jgi:beta-glucanase (GH16 family)
MQRFGFVTVRSLALALALGCDTGSTANEPADSDATGGSVASAGTAGVSAHNAAGTATTTGASAGGANTPPQEEDFKLLFRDDFDTLDLARWQLMTHSWDSNLALFSTSAATVADGMLTLSLLPAPAGTVDSGNMPKSFLGAEVRSFDTLTYGRVRANAKLAAGSAVVSSLVTIYTPWPADDWNELDIEHLGAKPTEVQLNTMVYTGPPTTPPVATSVTPTPDPLIKALGFDPSADFHVYTIEWTPTSARFSVDDTLLREWTTRIGLMTLPQNVLMTIWASNSVGWAGAVTEDTGKATAVYDWIELYELAP